MIGLSLIGISVIVSMEARVASGGCQRILRYGSLATGPVGLALFSGLMYAVVLLSIRHLRGVDVAWIGLVNHVASILCLWPLVIGQTPLPHGYSMGRPDGTWRDSTGDSVHDLCLGRTRGGQ